VLGELDEGRDDIEWRIVPPHNRRVHVRNGFRELASRHAGRPFGRGGGLDDRDTEPLSDEVEHGLLVLHGLQHIRRESCFAAERFDQLPIPGVRIPPAEHIRDVGFAEEATRGASVVYQCAVPPYERLFEESLI